MPSIDHIRLSSPKHAGARRSKLLSRCLRKSKHRVPDVSTAPANGSGLLPSSTLQPLRIIPLDSPRQKSTSPLPGGNPLHPSLNHKLQPLSFLWIRKRTPRNRKPTLPFLHPGYYFGRKASNPKARRRGCLCVRVLVGIRRIKGQRRAKEQTSRSPGS